MNAKLRNLFKIIIFISPIFGLATFASLNNNNYSTNNSTITHNINKSSRLTNVNNSVQNIALNDIMPYEDISSFSNTRSYEFSEIFIAPKNQPDNRFFTLTRDRQNLVFKQEKNNNEMIQNCNLDPRPMSPNNFQISRSQILLREISWNDDGSFNQKDWLNSSPTSGEGIGVKFDQLSGKGYFIADNTTITIPIQQNANYIIKFHIASLDENNPLTVFVKSNDQIYSSVNNIIDLKNLNYISADNDKHTGIETIFGLSTDNKYVISYDTNTIQQTTIFRLDIDSNQIISKLGNYKASEALNYLVLSNPNDNQIAWGDVISISGQVVLPTQYKYINLLIEANDSRGEIQIKYRVPYEFSYESTNGSEFRTIKTVTGGRQQILSITGFNAGSSILTNTVDLQNENINGLPQKIIGDENSINQLKQQVFSKCFAPGSLLDNFSPTTDMRLNNVSFNNLTGTINADLVLLNNYIDKDGNEVTAGNKQLSLGQIEFVNLDKISPTSLKAQTINIPTDSPLKDILPSQAKNNISLIRELICENISSILNNVPNDILANRNIMPADIIFYETNISEIGNNFIKINQTSINHYYNQTNGSYENSSPFIVNNLTISGFSEAKSTYIKNEVFTVPDMGRVYVEDYTQNQALQFLQQKQNENELLSFVDPSFNVLTDINIKNGTWTTNSQTGEIKFVIQAKNIYGANANIITQFKDLGTITLRGFKQVVKTQLITTNYNVGNFFGDEVADEISTDNIKNLLINLFNQNILFNSYDDAFNPNTDIAVSTTDLTVNAVMGTIDVRVNAKNIYNANLTIAQNFTYVGNIHLYGFNKKISTIVNNGVFNIQSLPTAFHELYANDVTVNDGFGNFNSIIHAFYEKGMILSNLPNDFNFNTNIINVSITPTKINEEWGVDATFQINNYLVDGKRKSEPPKDCAITLIGFKQLQSTRINGTIFNPNVEVLKVNCFKQHQAYNASIIENQIIDYGTSVIISTNNESILTSPLIQIENNPTNDPLVLDFSNATYNTTNNDNSILFSNVLVSGSYYSNDELDPIPVPSNVRKIMNIELMGFGKRDVSYTPLIITISIIIATIIGTTILVVIIYKIYQKLRISKNRYDAYEDTITKDMSF